MLRRYHQGHRQRFTELLIGVIAVSQDTQRTEVSVPSLALKEENHGA